MNHFFRKKTLIFAGALLLQSSYASSALVEAQDLVMLEKQLATHGISPVVVHLENLPIDKIASRTRSDKNRLQQKSQNLLNELGDHVLKAGRWQNGVGQMGFYVTKQGLDLLKGSSNAISFSHHGGYRSRTHLIDSEGDFEAIEANIVSTGSAEVEVLLNVEALEFSADKQMNRAYKALPADVKKAATSARVLVELMDKSELLNPQEVLGKLGALESSGQANGIRLKLNITAQGLIRLSDSDAFRQIKLFQRKNARPLQVDSSLADFAKRNVNREVILTMRESGVGGKLSPASHKKSVQSNVKILDDILSSLGQVKKFKDFGEFASVHVELTPQQIKQLIDTKDPRLLSISENRPVAEPLLTVSGPSMNMPSAWRVGYRGQGQHIIVMDTGVNANHPFLKDKVVLEACFGSTSGDYVSICPQADASGDSPLGLKGSAMPRFEANCLLHPSATSSQRGTCTHGTHVAGIAAGRLSPNTASGLQGVAPDAAIVAVQTGSYLKEGLSPLGKSSVINARADLVSAMQAAQNAMVPNTPASNPYTINLSLGAGSGSTAACNSETVAFSNALASLKNAGVPTVISSGNNGFTDKVLWPACVSGAIKVGSLVNNSLGNTRATSSNIINPSQIPGETFWMAPGQGVVSSVEQTDYISKSGTSMASPQIAGLYAVVKGVDPNLRVDDINAYLVANASQPVLMTANGSSLGFSLRKIRLPNF
ncbi:MAG: S8 family serine peptidase [Limnobacter sp.]|nr:S8 family serine peptidase [Limnobacter sp.]